VAWFFYFCASGSYRNNLLITNIIIPIFAQNKDFKKLLGPKMGDGNGDSG
jgi:hypothetical protein